jgi:outer membrane protein assembly factor BamB
VKRAFFAAVVLLLLLPPSAADAVIPSAFGPLQALLVVLPQLLLALAAAMVALFKPRTYRFLFGYLRAHPLLALVLVAGAAGAVWGAGRLFRAEVRAERGGGAWPAFRGGPERSGAVGDGPRRPPRVAWQVGADVLGSGARVDSSPAVVGNRVYFGAGLPAVLSAGTGAIHAVDLDTGGAVWSFTGAGALQPPLRPVFSSPAVAVENGLPRWLVCGEGYHEDRDCRIVVLDLASKPPKLHAAIQTTSHVESSPAIHEGRAYIGAGDDGFWCVDLASGKVAWRIDGDPHYEIDAGPEADTLADRAGGTVELIGAARRIFDAEHADRSTSVLRLGAAGRTVRGRLVEAPKDAKRPPGVSRFRIETALSLPDCESSPIVVPGEPPRVIFGVGIGGDAVVCADARSGAVLWKSAVPYPAFGPPSVVDGKVLIGLGNGNFIRSDPKPAGAVVCLALADGKELWRVPTGDVVLGAVAVREGRAFAASRDGKLSAIDLASGRVVETLAAGAPMVCSPALAASGLYATTDGGKLLCFERAPLRLRWSYPLAPGAQVISSPAIAAGRLLVGTATRGFLALSDPPGGDGPVPVRPWAGPGGTAERRGLADDLGPPAIATEEAVLRGPQADPLKRPVAGPMAACAGRVFAVFEQGPERKLAAVGASDAKLLWEISVGQVRALAADAARLYVLDEEALRALDPAGGGPLWGPVSLRAGDLTLDGGRLYLRRGTRLECRSAADGSALWSCDAPASGSAPAAAFDLLLLSSDDGLLCLSSEDGRALWRTSLSGLAPVPPSVTEVSSGGRRQGRVIVAVGSTLHCRSLLDGSAVWQAALDEPAVGPAAASEAIVAVPTKEHVKVYRTTDGKELAALPVGTSPATPAIAQSLIVMAAEGRIAAHDLTSGEWPWNYKDQDHVGRPTAGPLIAGGTIWVGTSRRGLVGIGVPDAARKP